MRFSLLAVGLLAFTAATASAGTSYAFSTAASYSGSGTIGGFGCPIGGLCIQFADGVDAGTGHALVIQLDYTPNNGIGVATTTDNFGFFQAFCLDSTNGSNDVNCGTIALSGDLTITVSQTVPFVATTGKFVDVLSGNISYNSGVPRVNFGTTSFDYTSGLISLNYAMQQPVGGYILPNPSTNNQTSFQGIVTDNSTPTPEPATLALFAGGLGLLGLMRRRKV
jgi:PEP-CTERM motif